MKDVPFKTLYLHGLVRAADGAKMSKSKGNTVDPLGLIDTYGADALRFFMAAMESQGRDIKMDERRVEGYRNFATKLWNAARFCQANGIGASATLEAPAATLRSQAWIIGETIQTVQTVDLALADLRFDAAANAIYQFVWSRFCDWYLELIKPQVVTASGRDRPGIQGGRGLGARPDPDPAPPVHAVHHRRTVARQPARDHDLIVAHWPQPDARSLDPAAEQEVSWLIRTDRRNPHRAHRAERATRARGCRSTFATPAPIRRRAGALYDGTGPDGARRPRRRRRRRRRAAGGGG
jgi:valyl-tRNA synthetase